jgi:hypothetical protein
MKQRGVVVLYGCEDTDSYKLASVRLCRTHKSVAAWKLRRLGNLKRLSGVSRQGRCGDGNVITGSEVFRRERRQDLVMVRQFIFF